jgi:hypothetical protein
MSGVAVDAGFSRLGLALELEACSGARGALKERKHQVNDQREKNVGNSIKEKKLTLRQQVLVSSDGAPQPSASSVSAQAGV